MKLTVFVMVLTAAFLHAFWNFAARKASGNLAVIWLGLSLANLLCAPFALGLWPPIQSIRSALPYMLATGMIHALYFAMLAKAYQEGEISFVYPIARGIGVTGTSIAAHILIGERISPVGAMGISAISAGIITLGLQTSHSRKEIRCGIIAFFVGCTVAGYSLVDKVAVGRVHPVFYIFSLFSFATFFLSPLVLLHHKEKLAAALRNMKRYILLIGPGSMVTYLIILFAFQLEKVSYIVAIREFAVVIGSALGITLLGERLTWRKCLGIVAITLGLLLVKLAG